MYSIKNPCRKQNLITKRKHILFTNSYVILCPVMTKVVLFFQAATLRSKAWRDKLAGVYRYADKAKWQVQMVQSGASADEINYMLDVWKPIGCIIDRSSSDLRNPTNLFRGIPVVLMDQNPRTARHGYSNVNHDSTATATLAAHELLQTNVETFSYVPHRIDTHWNRQRQRALSAAVRKAGKRFIDWGTTPFAGNLTTAQQDRLIAERLGQFPVPFGLLCANDQIAQRVMHMAGEVGLSIPRDMTIIGIDNDELICENTRPTLSSVLPDFQRGGYIAAELLDRVIRDPTASAVNASYGPLQLVRRQSTRRFTFQDPLVNRAMEIISEKGFDPSFHTEDLLDDLRCSRSLLEMRFRKEIGHSIREEVQRQRFEKALTLLRNPHQAITPVPTLCGYASDAFFKRLFKRKTGLTMREWRKQNLTTTKA